MFFHTHVFYAKKVNQNLDHLTVIGSILPDLALTSIISWDALHKKNDIEAFSEFVNDTNPAFLPLLTGIQYHNTVDVLSHLQYKGTIGYAYKKVSPELITLLTQAFSIDEEAARVKGHNFIESGVEIHTLKDHQELAMFLKQAINDTDINNLANLLSTFYKKDQKETSKRLEKYFSLATDFDLQNTHGWLSLWNEISNLQFGRNAEKEKIKKALDLASEITIDTYQEFLAAAVAAKGAAIQDSN